MKKLSLVLMVAALLVLGGQAFGQVNINQDLSRSAQLCSIDEAPAATLLVPYFEVDLANPDGITTLFSINNASATPTIAHVVFWTDWSYPTIDFDIYLTGYDVQTVNVREVFAGNLPVTADAPRDPADTISPHQGSFANNPNWDDTDLLAAGLQGFPGCAAILPFSNPVIQGPALDRLLNGHTGQPVGAIGGDCLGADHGDDVARGYITIDDARECSLVLDPADPAYFIVDGSGIATDENQLWGDWFLVDFENDFAQGDALVHIEAVPNFTGSENTVPPSAVAGTGYTFYGRYTAVGGIPDGRDNREPLGTTWGTRYLNGGAFDQTQLIVWRDSTFNQNLNVGANCGSLAGRLVCGVPGCIGPNWFPLNETQVVAFNEAEDAVEICFFTGGVISPPVSSDPACFPYETGRYNFGDSPLRVPFNFGWAFLNLNIPSDSSAVAGEDVDWPRGTNGDISQSYVTTVHSAFGRFSVGLSAVEITSACQDLNPTITGVIPTFQ